MAGHSYKNKQNFVRCGYPLKDGTPCQVGARLNGRCEHHSVIELGTMHGWSVNGSRKAEAYHANRGDTKLFAKSARELFHLIQENEEASDTQRVTVA